MLASRRLVITVLFGTFPFLALSPAAHAKTVVEVALWDKGPTSMDMMETAVPMGMAMQGGSMDMAKMGITASSTEIPAGEVTFEVVNESNDFYHAVAISPVKDPASPPPYLTGEKKVDEDSAGLIGEVKELKPHQSGRVTLNLTPGTYILYCNIPGHYMLGMWTLLTVTE